MFSYLITRFRFSLIGFMTLGYLLCAFSFFESAQADEALYTQHCGICHTLNPDESPRQGPHLAGVIGRKAGSLESFPYSNSVKSLGITWDADSLDRWLQSPADMASDTYMMYQQPDAEIRSVIVRYLSTQ